MKVLGIDIGGTGIKGAVVDTKRGVLKTDRLRLPTPEDATPDAVANVLAAITDHFEWDGPLGCTFPGVTRGGHIHTATNLAPEWIGAHAEKIFSEATGCPVAVLNDADAAGLAECHFGAAAGQRGVSLLLTLGTGIGSALVIDGELVPNTELGHLKLDGGDAEVYASEHARERDGLDWDAWAARLSEYLELVELLFWPDIFIIGGGVSKKSDKFFPQLTCRTPVTAAKLHNQAGIVGAAMAAHKHLDAKKGKGKGRG